MIIHFIIQLDWIELVQFLSMIYSFLIEFILTNSTFIFEVIILFQAKLKWFEIVDVFTIYNFNSD